MRLNGAFSLDLDVVGLGLLTRGEGDEELLPVDLRVGLLALVDDHELPAPAVVGEGRGERSPSGNVDGHARVVVENDHSSPPNIDVYFVPPAGLEPATY